MIGTRDRQRWRPPHADRLKWLLEWVQAKGGSLTTAEYIGYVDRACPTEAAAEVVLRRTLFAHTRVRTAIGPSGERTVEFVLHGRG